MYHYHRYRATIYLIIGILLFMFSVGTFLFRISLALLGLSLINQGLRLKGLPPLHFMLQSWFDSFRF